MTAIYTFDVFSSLDGFGSYGPDGDWGGYWGKQGPEFLDRRLAVIGEEQRMVLGANTFRQFVEMLGPIDEAELDPGEQSNEEPADDGGVDNTRGTFRMAGLDDREWRRRRCRRPAKAGV